MKNARIALLCCTASLWTGACAEAPVEPTPEGAVLESVAALRKNDLRAFLAVTLTKDAMARMAGEWNNKRAQPLTKDEKEQFQKQMNMLTAPGAEESLFAVAAPQLAKMKPQITSMAGFLSGMAEMQLTQDETLGAAEKAVAQKMVAGFSQWVQKNDITDNAKLEKAIAIVCKTARKLEVANLDQFAALNFFQLLDKGDSAIAGLKGVLDVYGMDIDGFLKSVQATTVSSEGDTAMVSVSFTFLGERHTVETEMVRAEGRWFGKSSLDKQAALKKELQASF